MQRASFGSSSGYQTTSKAHGHLGQDRSCDPGSNGYGGGRGRERMEEEGGGGKGSVGEREGRGGGLTRNKNVEGKGMD